MNQNLNAQSWVSYMYICFCKTNLWKIILVAIILFDCEKPQVAQAMGNVI